MKSLRVALFCAVTLTHVIDAQGAMVTNGNFEFGIAPGTTKPNGSTDVTGWTVILDGIDWVDGIGTVPEIKGTNGDFFVDLNGSSTNPGGIQQVIATQIGTLYLVTFDMNANTNNGGSRSLRVSAAGQQADFVFVPNANTDTVWKPQSFLFVASGASTTLVFQSLVTGTNGGPLLDNVSVAVAVPEPGSLVTAVAGLCGIALWRAREARRARSARR